MRIRIARSAMALVLAAILPGASRAAWREDGIPAATFIVTQNKPVAVADGTGGAIVVWEDPGAPTDLHAQRLDARGEPLWGPGGIAVCTAAGFQWETVIVSDGAGGAIVAWRDDRGADPDIYAQRVDADGNLLWPAQGLVVCGAAGFQVRPTIATDGAGGAIISWQDNRGATGDDIYTQRVDAAGLVRWTADGVELVQGALSQQDPVSVSDGNGGAIVAFIDMRNEGGGDIYMRKVNSNGQPTGTNGGTAVCTAAGVQGSPRIVSDGEQGSIIVWLDLRDGNIDVFAQRMSFNSQPLWTANGVRVCNNPEDQNDQACVSDGAGGVIVSWKDNRWDSQNNDIYAQRLNSAGALLWTASGVPITEVADQQEDVAMVGDGAGGAVIVWEDYRDGIGPGDVYAAHVDADGQVDWAPGGAPVSDAPGYQQWPLVVADGSGGGLVVWDDSRNGSRIYVQRMEGRYGEWGHPEPSVESVVDNPGDQGGQVIVSWAASGRDRFDDPLIAFYSLWRATDADASSALTSSTALAQDFAGSLFWLDENEIYWEWLANYPASYLSHYSALAPTRQDSTGGDPATHRFLVLAHDWTQPVRIWESNAAEGYSVDDLAPAAPLELFAQRVGGDVQLSWSDVEAPDLRDYAIYRATEPGVQPDAENLVAWSLDSSAVDANAPTSSLYYVVAAFDVHDNQGPPSDEASVSNATAVGDPTLPARLTVRPGGPNPFRGVTALSVGLPSRTDLCVTVFDIGGRRVRSLEFASLSAGWRRIDLAGHGRDGPPLASGVYLYRVEAGGEAITGKMVIAR